MAATYGDRSLIKGRFIQELPCADMKQQCKTTLTPEWKSSLIQSLAEISDVIIRYVIKRQTEREVRRQLILINLTMLVPVLRELQKILTELSDIADRCRKIELEKIQISRKLDLTRSEFLATFSHLL